MTGRPANEDRLSAKSLGFKTYQGSIHAKCGTTERYVSGVGCVYCARTIATEQREARRLMKAHAQETVNPDPEEIATAQEELDEQDAAMQDDFVADARDDAAERSRQ